MKMTASPKLADHGLNPERTVDPLGARDLHLSLRGNGFVGQLLA
jgi:hypothetical protein